MKTLRRLSRSRRRIISNAQFIEEKSLLVLPPKRDRPYARRALSAGNTASYRPIARIGPRSNVQPNYGDSVDVHRTELF